MNDPPPPPSATSSSSSSPPSGDGGASSRRSDSLLSEVFGKVLSAFEVEDEEGGRSKARVKERTTRELLGHSLASASSSSSSSDVAAVQEAVVRALEDLGLSKEVKNLAYMEAQRRAWKVEAKRGMLSPQLARALGDAFGGELAWSGDGDSGGNGEQGTLSSAACSFGGDLLDPVRDASARWIHSIHMELLALQEERNRPLARVRDDGSQTESVALLPQDGFLFDTEDLLSEIEEIRCGNRSDFLLVEDAWRTVRLHLETPTLEELRSMHPELSPDEPVAGTTQRSKDGASRECERRALGLKVLGVGFVPLVKQYGKQGIPTSLRPRLWRLMLALPEEASVEEIKSFRSLLDEGRRVDLITDELYQLDVQAIADDDKFFVFEERLSDVMLAFSRDTWILENCQVRIHAALQGYACEGQSGNAALPPCGVQPFRGLVSYAAPLCFLYADAAELYHVLRIMYADYWCHLNALQSGSNSLLFHLKLFEDLLIRHAPSVVETFIRHGLAPLKIAASWIQFSFVGFLEVQELLVLWDLILAYDRLLLIPVLAASIFVFRAEALKSASDSTEIQEILADGSQLEVMPLLQAFLFPEAQVNSGS